MADVVQVARERREKLVAEIARLDSFIQTATELAKAGDGPEELADALTAAAEGETEDELLLTDPVTKAANESGGGATAERLSGTENDIHVGKMIRHRRWMMGISQEQLAERIGLKLEYVQDYETGARRVGTSVLRNIAMAMDVPVSFFYEEIDEAASDDDEFIENILTEK